MLDLSKINLFADLDDEEDVVEIEDLSSREIAVIGMAVKLPMAETAEEFWGHIAAKRDCVRTMPEKRLKDVKAYFHHISLDDQNISISEVAYLEEIDQFDYPFFGISPKEASLLDPVQRLFLETAWEALEDGGYAEHVVRGSRTGVYVGFGGFKSSKYDQLITEVDPTVGALSKTGKTPSLTAGRLAYLLDLHGPCMMIDTACSGSLVAVHLACQGIRNGDCEMAIAGGASLKLCPIHNQEKIGIESSDGRAKTFDDRSDGTGGGEGIVAVLLKPLSRAFRDGDNIYAVIKGTAINSDGTSNGITAPNALAQEDVIVHAWKDSGIDPETITYWEAHGTGTKLGDPIEMDGLTRAFRRYTDKRQFCSISSLKTNVGHLDSCAGIAGMVKAILALQNKMLPPSNHFERPNRNIDFINAPVYVSDRAQPWETNGIKRRCGVSAFGLSGTNCHVVLEEAPEVEGHSVEPRKVHILTLAAKSPISLHQMVERYLDFLKHAGEINLNNLCFSANTGRTHYRHRMAIVFESRDEFHDQLAYLTKAPWAEVQEGDIFHGVYTGNAEVHRQPFDEAVGRQLDAFLRTGQKQREMLRVIARQYVQGVQVPWERLYAQEAVRKIRIPVYPFERKRCWFEVPKQRRLAQSGLDMLNQLQQELDHLVTSASDPAVLRDEVQELTARWKAIIERGGVVESDTEDTVTLSGRGTGEYSEKEKVIAQIWGDVIGLKEVDIHADFFELGGNSLYAIQLVSRLKQHFDITMNILYQNPTVELLAQAIRLKQDNLKSQIEALKQSLSRLPEGRSAEIQQRLDELQEQYQRDYQARMLHYDNIQLEAAISYQDILITGATGFLGMYLLRDLLQQHTSNIHVLVRGETVDQARERLEQKMKFYFGPELYQRYQHRIQIVKGELRLDHFGLTTEEYDTLAATIDCVIHSAANTSHYGPYEEFYQINVEGTERLLEWAMTGREKIFHHISTMAVTHGVIPDQEYFLFTEFDCDVNQQFRNFYAQSKWEAEKRVMAARQKGLKANMYRVGNLMLDSRTGQFQENIEANRIYRVIQAFLQLGVIPAEMYQDVDVSYVDYVSRAITLLFDKAELTNETYHIYNPHWMSFSELLTMEGVCLPIQPLPVVDFLDYVQERISDNALQPQMETLLLHLGIINQQQEPQEAHGIVRIGSDKTVHLLQKMGLNWLPATPDTVEKMITYGQGIGFFAMNKCV